MSSLAERIGREHRLAFDTEAASFHRYHDRIYLIQLSSVHETAIIDPLALDDLSPLGALLADPAIQIVFHDADYDLRSLNRDYGFRARNIFDSRIAAQLLGEPAVSLGALLLKYFEVALNKKMQRADWSQRPLTPEMINYAAADTAHLLPLRDVLEGELRKRGRWEWALEEFARLESVRGAAPVTGPNDYLRLKGASTLAPRVQIILQALYQWRDAQARALDRAPFRVLPNEVLVALAQATPSTEAGLRDIPRVSSSVIDRFGGELIGIIRGALSVPADEWPRREPTRTPRPDGATEQRLERLKQMRNDRARELGIEPGVLAPNAALLALAWQAAPPGRQPDPDQGAELRRWQRIALGEEPIRLALLGQGASVNPKAQG
jgi:ribonuclease D